MRALLVASLAVLVSCSSSQVQDCGDGFLCPPGQMCAPGRDQCVVLEQLTSCQGKPDGTACSFAGVNGACSQGVCTAFVPSCGNGKLDPGEVCDGAPPPGSCLDYGFDAGRLGCSMTCGPDLTGCRRIGWTPIDPGTTQTILRVWATGPNDVWLAAGPDGLRHFDGKSSSAVSAVSGDVVDVWGGARNDLWIISESGGEYLAHLTGSPPVAMASEPVPGPMQNRARIWGSNAGDVYFLVGFGDVYHYGDVDLVPTVVGALAEKGPFDAIWGSGAFDVWVSDDAMGLLHFEGQGWNAVNPPPPVPQIVDGWASSPSDVYAINETGIAVHFDGKTWSMPPVPSPTSAIWGSAGDDVFAVGGGGILHFDGAGWTAMQSTASPMMGLAGSSARDVYAFGASGALLHYAGAAWGTSPGAPANPTTVWGTGPSDIFAADGNNIYHFDGSTWTTQVMGAAVRAISGRSSSDVVAVGGSIDPVAIRHYDGTSWSSPPPAGAQRPDLNDVWLAPDGYGGFAVGRQGVCSVSSSAQGASLSCGLSLPSSGATMDTYGGVWGSAAHDVYVVGTALWHFDGSQWSVSKPFPAPATHVWGSDPHDVYVVGDGFIAHGSGTTWTLSPVASNLTYVWGAGPNDVFAIGDKGILHFDGAGWAPVRPPTNGSLAFVWGTPSNVWFGGGTLLVRTALPGP